MSILCNKKIRDEELKSSERMGCPVILNTKSNKRKYMNLNLLNKDTKVQVTGKEVVDLTVIKLCH